MKRFLISLIAALGFSVGAVAVVPAVVQAYPSNCSTSISGSRAAASCWGGSGRFRVVGYLVSGGSVSGPCMPVGYISTVYAGGIYRAGWQTC